MRYLAVALLASAWAVSAAGAQEKAPAPSPAVTITLGPRHGHVTPQRVGFTHTGGGNIDVAQPAPDTVAKSFGKLVELVHRLSAVRVPVPVRLAHPPRIAPYASAAVLPYPPVTLAAVALAALF